MPTYFLTVRYTVPSAPNEWHETKFDAPFTRWFTADGYFVPKPFQQWLASEVPAIGEADPNNVVEEIGRGSGIEKQASSQGISLEDLVSGISSTATPGGKKARRRG